jgi:hypothetical protein
LFDNYLNGDFIYQVRLRDPARRLGVLRGDKLFYGVLSDPHAAYREYVTGEEDMLSLIYRYDPELIVAEDPQIAFQLPKAALLRKILETRTDRFRLERTIALRTNVPAFSGVSLRIYRSLLRNPRPEPLLRLEMAGMGSPLETAPHRENP